MEIRFPIIPIESLEQFYICQHLRHGDAVIDVGAYEGLYTFLGAALVGPSGKMVAVEPEAKARTKLLENLAGYPFRQVQVVPGAAFSRSGSMPFYLSQVHYADNRLWANEAEDAIATQVPCWTIDDIAHDLAEVHLLKLDVQGAEVEVLKGASKTIARSPNLAAMVEYWPYGLLSMGNSGQELLAILDGYGFQVFLIDVANNKLIRVDRHREFIMENPNIADPNTATTSPVANLWCVKRPWDTTQPRQGNHIPDEIYIAWPDS